MHTRPVVIVDSGFGGFSLVATLEAELPAGTGLELLYVNAAPSDALGYNQMSGSQQREGTLTNVLRAIDAGVDPQAIVLASHTLSTIFMGLRPELRGTWRVETLLDDALALVEQAHREEPERVIAVLGTATMAGARRLQQRAAARGIPADCIVHEACPGLESAISGDPQGSEVARRLRGHRDALYERLGRVPRRLALLLGCTHYAHRTGLFADVFAERGVEVDVLDPGQAVARSLVCHYARGSSAGLSVTMVSRYRPPARELTTIAGLIEARAPRAAAAVRGYRWRPDFFEVAAP